MIPSASRLRQIRVIEVPARYSGNRVDLRHEASKHNDLFAFLHAAVDNVFQRIEFCRRELLRIVACIVPDETACDLRQTKQLGQHISRGDFAIHELGETVFFDTVIDLLGVLLQLDRSHFLHEFGQIDRFVDPDPVCDGVCLFDQFRQMLVPDDLMVLKSADNGVIGAEAVEAATENAFVEELVLAEEIQRAVRDRGAGQDQVVFADLSEPVQRLRAFRLRVLDLARFVADDHVRVPLREFRFQTPTAFVFSQAKCSPNEHFKKVFSDFLRE